MDFASLALQVAPVTYYKYGTMTQMLKSHLTRYAYPEIMGSLLICISKMAVSSSQKFSQRFLKEIFCSEVQVFFWGEIFDITPIKSSTAHFSKIYKLFAVPTLFSEPNTEATGVDLSHFSHIIWIKFVFTVPRKIGMVRCWEYVSFCKRYLKGNVCFH